MSKSVKKPASSSWGPVEASAASLANDGSGIFDGVIEATDLDADGVAREASGFAALSAVETPDTIVPGADFFAARDELLSRLGGAESMFSAFSASADEAGAENIQGVGVGLRMTAGRLTGDLCVKVFVRQKLRESQVGPQAAIPQSVGGLETDVEEVGDVLPNNAFRMRHTRPVPCGVSCGHPNVTAGTIGALVVLNNGKLCILSNNHILANENDALIGDRILQPGTVDANNNPNRPLDTIARLEAFVRMNPGSGNLVDAAVAFTNSQAVKPNHVTYRVSPSPVAASVGMSVMKNGRTTGSTMGTVIALGVNSLRIPYRRFTASFDNQIAIRGVGTDFSAGGDSGSLIVTLNSKQPVGLLFAGGNGITFANPIGTVMSQLGIARFV